MTHTPISVTVLCTTLLTTLPVASIRGQSVDTTDDRGRGWVDTTMQPGRLDVSKYTPSSCLAAAVGTRRVAERAALDSGTSFRHDTLPSVAVAMARMCSRHFAVASTPENELLSLMQLGLMAGDDALAQAAVDRRVALLADPVQRGQALLESDTAYLGARPARIATAEMITARLDSLGPVVALKQYVAHRQLRQYARSRMDLPRLEQEAVTTWRLRNLVNPAEFRFVEYEVNCLGAASDLWGLYILLDALPPMDALTRAVQLQKQAGCPQPEMLKTIMSTLQPGAFLLTHLGQPVPPPPGTFWFGPEGQRTWPVPGKVSIYIPYDHTEGMSLFHLLDGQVKRLKKKYGDQINITYGMQTKGYFHDSGPLTPAQEAERLRKYVQDELHLPVSLVVEEVPMQRLSDGRYVKGRITKDGRIVQDESNVGFYTVHGINLLTDQAGKLVFWNMVGGPDQWVEALVDRALGRKAGQK